MMDSENIFLFSENVFLKREKNAAVSLAKAGKNEYLCKSLKNI